MPYRVDIAGAGDTFLDRLVELGALDVEAAPGGGIAALMPDGIAPEHVARALGVDHVSISPAVGRDAGSVWILRPRATRIGRLRIVPAHAAAEPGALRLIDSVAFGTGLHATTAMCLEAIEEALQPSTPGALLDVGTGSGVLALGALLMGVPHAVGLDIDAEALRAAAENARINGVDRRLRLVRGGPEAIAGTWPLVVANVLAAPLVELAPVLVRRVGHHGRLVLSGIPPSLEGDVDRAYRRLGMYHLRVQSRAGWSVLVLLASW
ncbi:MAG TPA: 50S ribosomal protein L11 methyltransferase [Methylomirabilota bacterium]|nr:50S ribosomal protein L11 methyltransferase [Methylomirabilota bacterium]